MLTRLKNRMIVGITAAFLFSFFVFCIWKKEDAFSISERRALASFPVISKTGVFTGKFTEEFEEYALDQFPLRDAFRSLKAHVSRDVYRQRDNHGIYMEDGYASKLEYPMDSESIEYATKRFSLIYDRYLRGHDGKVYLSIIPDKNYFMAQLRDYPAMDYGQFVSKVQKGMEFAEYIDIMPFLELSDYYRTDIHWRQEKITDVACGIAAGMGSGLSGGYESIMADSGFYGVYCAQSALPLAPDGLYYLENEAIRQYRVYDYETSSEISVYDFKKVHGNDAYEMFLSGSKSLLTIENPAALSEKELIIFRDSFGSSLAPLLAEGYRKTTLVDIRYISPELLGRFLSFDGQDVLFLYSTPVLNNSISIK